jgi:ADP-ribose pyrophosphatase YjhB (NUDIX family)
VSDSLPLLRLVEKLLAISQTGLAYTEGVFDRERYEQLHALTQELLQHVNTGSLAQGSPLPFEIGYRTPKIDVRAVILQDNAVLLARETSDGRWSLPGGWADVGLSAAKNVEKEVLEETGYTARALRLLALLDRDLHGHHGGSAWHTYKAFFECEILGGAPTATLETDAVEFFRLDKLPPLSSPRITEAQLQRVCALIQDPSLPPWFD